MSQPPHAARDFWWRRRGPLGRLTVTASGSGRLDRQSRRVSPNPYAHLWWVINPDDPEGCCADCQRYAAASPYDPPWVVGGNDLDATPGDGRTQCGPACTCSLSYDAPGHRPAPVYANSRAAAEARLNYRQRHWVGEHLPWADLGGYTWPAVRALILVGWRLVTAADTESFRLTADRAQLGTATGADFTVTRSWPAAEVLWPLEEGAWRRVAATWPRMPEWDPAIDT